MKAFNVATASTPDLERLIKCPRNAEDRRAIAEELADRRKLYSRDTQTGDLFQAAAQRRIRSEEAPA